MEINVEKIAFAAVHVERRLLKVTCSAADAAARDKHSDACQACAGVIIDAISDYRAQIGIELRKAAERARVSSFASVQTKRGERYALSHATLTTIAEMLEP